MRTILLRARNRSGLNPAEANPNSQSARSILAAFSGLIDPDIEIVRGPDMTVRADRVTANQQVFNAVRVERLQELFEVPR